MRSLLRTIASSSRFPPPIKPTPGHHSVSISSRRTMASSTNANTDLNATQNESNNPTSSTSTQVEPSTDLNAPQNDQTGIPLPLPAPPSEEETQKLDMSSGEANIKMDRIGPLVLNRDGTLSRISNWEQMTEIERKNTLRILGKRNQLRREALDGKEEGK